MQDKVKIIIIEDNHTFREGLKMLLNSIPEYEVIADSDSFLEIEKKNVFHLANIVLLDLLMPEVHGIDAAKRILWDFPQLPIIAITMFTEQAYLLELMGAGFKGCVFKSDIYNEIDEAIKIVLSGKRYFPTGIKLKK